MRRFRFGEAHSATTAWAYTAAHVAGELPREVCCATFDVSVMASFVVKIKVWCSRSRCRFPAHAVAAVMVATA
jgi:hypothetical protein